ncbi:sulfotransferase family protein [Spongiactinospora sp. TRM90649]|uniref:sulfotransferase family protein n=1 Tax=Spongiactinospora sp. TRM90649 TaxID=3031114 RepID=UPI0023F87F75|nr:sulfotransferase family protein [Spongiactinospora sp. TRM90649]MDF5758052.1 sulfotransferase [Spongiactinospora sp. TRM90649]
MISVIGAGLPRTGTTSLKTALERLGFGPCHHMQEIAAHPDQAQRWRQILDGPIDWNGTLDGYRAAVDWPSAHFWRPLSQAYPDAKVILTVRDPHAWYASLRDTVFALLTDPGAAPGALRPMLAAMRPLLARVWSETFGTTLDEPMPEERHAVEVFRRRTDEVTSALPADRILIHESRQGWEPLCGFLGVPVPDEPYPHLNDQRSAQARLRGAADR